MSNCISSFSLHMHASENPPFFESVKTFFDALTQFVLKIFRQIGDFFNNLFSKPQLDLQSKAVVEDSNAAPLSAATEKAILYMPITGNPTHLGHMTALATAIDVLVKKGVFVEKALISLAAEDYHKTKAARVPGKVAISQEAREYLLNGAIAEAARRQMFQSVPVSFWNDQDQGRVDHPESYRRLTESSQTPVYLVGGFDLCQLMGNWVHSIQHAIVVSRNEGEDPIDKLPAVPASFTRYFSPPLYPQFKALSSSDIQKGKAQLEPIELQKYFEIATNQT